MKKQSHRPEHGIKLEDLARKCLTANMPTQPIISEDRLNNIITCLSVTNETLGILASSVKTPFLDAISVTTQALLKNIQVTLVLKLAVSSLT